MSGRFFFSVFVCKLSVDVLLASLFSIDAVVVVFVAINSFFISFCSVVVGYVGVLTAFCFVPADAIVLIFATDFSVERLLATLIGLEAGAIAFWVFDGFFTDERRAISGLLLCNPMVKINARLATAAPPLSHHQKGITYRFLS